MAFNFRIAGLARPNHCLSPATRQLPPKNVCTSMLYKLQSFCHLPRKSAVAFLSCSIKHDIVPFQVPRENIVPFQVPRENIPLTPFHIEWMPFRACPPGLEYLDNLNQVRFHERRHTLALGRECFQLEKMNQMFVVVLLLKPLPCSVGEVIGLKLNAGAWRGYLATGARSKFGAPIFEPEVFLSPTRCPLDRMLRSQKLKPSLKRVL